MSDPARRGLYLSTYEGQRVIDARFRILASRIESIVAELGERPLEQRDRITLMARFEQEFDSLFPERRGASSPLELDIVQVCARSRVRALKSALSPIMRMVRRKDPELADRMAPDADR